MVSDVETLKRNYERFNARDIDAVLSTLAVDVVWANGMEGGHVHGREAVRAYWSRQLDSVAPHVEPLSFDKRPDGSIAVEVRQSIFAPDGTPLKNQTHGLKDKAVRHIFRFHNGKIVRFDIEEGA